MIESLKKLTEALQELERQRKEDKKPSDLPKELSINELVFSKDLSDFIGTREVYSEKTSDVNVGQY